MITSVASQAEGDTEVGFVSLFPLAVGYMMDMRDESLSTEHMLTTYAELPIAFKGYELC